MNFFVKLVFFNSLQGIVETNISHYVYLIICIKRLLYILQLNIKGIYQTNFESHLFLETKPTIIFNF